MYNPELEKSEVYTVYKWFNISNEKTTNMATQSIARSLILIFSTLKNTFTNIVISAVFDFSIIRTAFVYIELFGSERFNESLNDQSV